VIAGFPARIRARHLPTGSLLIETIFSLDGLGLLWLRERCSNRDYRWCAPRLYIFSLVGLALNSWPPTIYLG